VLDPLVAQGLLAPHVALARGRGSVLLVKAGNPKRLRDMSDLAREDVTLFISNPRTEAASYALCADTLKLV
jgi:ABC-type sulfate transport system substrate-binding protein